MASNTCKGVNLGHKPQGGGFLLLYEIVSIYTDKIELPIYSLKTYKHQLKSVHTQIYHFRSCNKAIEIVHNSSRYFLLCTIYFSNMSFHSEGFIVLKSKLFTFSPEFFWVQSKCTYYKWERQKLLRVLAPSTTFDSQHSPYPISLALGKAS